MLMHTVYDLQDADQLCIHLLGEIDDRKGTPGGVRDIQVELQVFGQHGHCSVSLLQNAFVYSVINHGRYSICIIYYVLILYKIAHIFIFSMPIHHEALTILHGLFFINFYNTCGLSINFSYVKKTLLR